MLNTTSYLKVLIIGLLIGALYYIFFYQSKNYSAIKAQLENEIQSTNQEISVLDKSIKEVQELEAEIEGFNASLKKAYDFIPIGADFLNLEQAVSNKARTSGLAISSLDSEKSWTMFGALDQAGAQVQLQGSFRQLMVFLSELTREDKVYSVKSFDINLPEQQETSSEKLSFRGQILTYKRRPTEKAEAL